MTRPTYDDTPPPDLAFRGTSPADRAVLLTADDYRTLAQAARVGQWTGAGPEKGFDARRAGRWAAAVARGLVVMSDADDAPAPQVGRMESVGLGAFRQKSGTAATLSRLGGPSFVKGATALLALCEAGSVTCSPTPAMTPGR